jgi:hypothetical protein
MSPPNDPDCSTCRQHFVVKLMLQVIVNHCIIDIANVLYRYMQMYRILFNLLDTKKHNLENLFTNYVNYFASQKLYFYMLAS